MKSHDLCIIHLSDLHFSDGVYKSVFEMLIRDIRDQVRDDADIVIAVTGDLVTKKAFSKNSENVLKFFKGILDVLPAKAKLLDVEIVPGNHDGDRAIESDDYNAETYLHKLDSYDDLVFEIYNIFRQRFRSLKVHDRVGTTSFDFYGRQIMFCRLDSSSFELPSRLRSQVEARLRREGVSGEDKIWKLESKFTKAFADDFINQLKKVGDEYRAFSPDNEHKKLDLVISLLHHPASMLRIDGYDTIEDALFKNNFEFTDVSLSGHTHVANHDFASHNSRQKIMLSTGMGWDESPNDFRRYSIYRINLDRNTCQVAIRYSVSNDDFKPDIISGANDEFALYKHLTLPLKVKSVGAAIHANAIEHTQSKSIYADTSVIEYIPKILKEFEDARMRIVYKIVSYGEIAQSARKKQIPKGVFKRIVWSLCNDVSGSGDLRRCIIKQHSFADLINVICGEISQVLRNLSNIDVSVDARGREAERGRIEWRVHARQYKGKKDAVYTKKNDSYIATRAIDVMGVNHAKVPSDVQWISMIESAFSSKKYILINSANPTLNRHNTDWSDFVTFLPQDNKFVKVFPQKQRRPLLTFGVSFRVEDADAMNKATRILYLLEYLGLHGLVEDSLVFFVKKYNFTVGDIIKELR